jgi:CMP-N,N'-diacetyllegionaminic acid synthase
MRRCLAYIPARAGSKRVPNKNVRTLGGQPLIAYTIQVALERFRSQSIHLSTDSRLIADLARDQGLEESAMRRPNLGRDDTTTLELLLDEITRFHWAEHYEWILVLPPTSPMRLREDLDAMLAQSDRGREAISVTDSSANPRNLYGPIDQTELSSTVPLPPSTPESRTGANKQDWPRYVRRNGSMYLLNIARLMRSRALLSEDVWGVLQPPERSFDLDTEFDFVLLEAFLSHLGMNSSNWPGLLRSFGTNR